MKKLYVDDMRDCPDGWDLARNYADAIQKLSSIEYDLLSLDHDIASWDEKGYERTGYDIALWLAERKVTQSGYVPSVITCHSANPVGIARIEGVVARYLK